MLNPARTTRAVPLAIVTLCAILTACAGDGVIDDNNPFKPGRSEREQRLEAGKLYKLARQSLDSSDFIGALSRYDQIGIKYPYTDYATQAKLESLYARYRNFEADEAVEDATRFLKEHPRHKLADYVYYLRGLAQYDKGDALLAGLPGTSPEQHDVGYARRAFDDFALLMQKYPKSRYTGDARLRMIELRNRLAAHELAIVQFYVRRGAHLAAAKRGERLIADFPGAPATLDTLRLLESSYRTLGLTAQADDAQRLLQNTLNPTPASTVAEPPVTPPVPVAAPAPPALEPPPKNPSGVDSIETTPLPSP